MAGVPPINHAKDASNLPTAANDVADTANVTETGIDTLPCTSPP